MPTPTPNQPVVTPALVGTAAPSTAPGLPTSPAELKKLINDTVEQQVKERLEELQQDPTREDVTGEEDPFGNFDRKLDIFGVDLSEHLPNFHLRWFNDEADRIVRMNMMGYEFVKRTEVALNTTVVPLNQDLGDNIAVYVGSQQNGQPLRAILMKIPKDIFEKRQAKIQRQCDLVDESIRRGAMGTALQNRGYAGTDQGAIKIVYDPRAAMSRPR